MDNAHKYNIKVVNLSIGTNDRKVNLPLKEAVERLWQMGIVVVWRRQEIRMDAMATVRRLR